MSFLIKPCASYFLSYATIRIAAQGFSDLFGLVTLRHGTNPIYWLGIHVLGAKPEKEGSQYGSKLSLYDDLTDRKFYVTADSLYYNKKNPFDLYACALDHSINTLTCSDESENLKENTEKVKFEVLIDQLSKEIWNINLQLYLLRLKKFNADNDHIFDTDKVKTTMKSKFSFCCNKLEPKMSSYVSTDRLFRGRYSSISLLKSFPSIILALILPTIKFHLTPNRVDKEFIAHIDYQRLAPDELSCNMSTKTPIGPWNIGLIGILWNSLSTATIYNMRDNLNKVCWGIAEIAFSVALGLALAKAFPALFIANKTAMIAGAILAAI